MSSLVIGLLRLIVLVINEMHPRIIKIQEITVIDVGRLFIVFVSFLPNEAFEKLVCDTIFLTAKLNFEKTTILIK